MKALATVILFTTAATLVPAQDAMDQVPSGPSGQGRNRLFGDFTMGLSNYGMAGEAKVYYRTANKFFSAGYYQSHVCTAGDYNGIPPWGSGGVTHHVSFQSYSASVGTMLPRKLKQGISAGISITKFRFELTDPILNDFSIDGLSRELGGEGFGEHSHGMNTKLVVGIPIEYKLFLLNKGWIGLDVAAKVDLNMTRIFSAITVGVRIGK